MGCQHLMTQVDLKRIIVALDYANSAEALAMADRLDPARCRLKVGKELFTREGPQIIRGLQDRGFDIFLDLKFHDIPNTTAAACTAAADLGVWMINVHALGGRRMMEAASKAIEPFPTLLIAVTVLTSMEAQDLSEIGLQYEPAELVPKLASLAQQSGLDGVVCSAHEARHMRDTLGGEFHLVTPGVRPAGADKADQRRIMTPAQALGEGASYLVIGRPITRAADPASAFEQIFKETLSAS